MRCRKTYELICERSVSSSIVDVYNPPLNFSMCIFHSDKAGLLNVMDQFFQFVVNHWILWAAALVVLILIIRVELSDQIFGVRLVSSQEATLLLNRQEAVLVDLREDTQFK